jgi:hypothetical protein
MTGTVATQVKAIAFDRDIERLTEGFTGREWVFEEIDRWFQQGNERFFILTGEPGVGKSAIAAQLTQTRKDIAAYHFCIARQISTVEPNNVLLSLAAQLIKYFPNYGEALVNTVKPLFLQVNVEINIENIRDSVVQGVVIENLHIHYPKQALDIVLRQALAALPNPPKEPVSILIDSLDEAVTYSNENNLVTLLSSVDDLPSWARFILTSRPDKQRVLSYFETLKPYYYHLNELSEKNKNDIHQYVDGRVVSEPIQAQIQRFQVLSEALINQITELSQGNFLYTKVLLDDIELGGQPIDNLAALPKSLNELYHNFLLRLKAEWEGKYQPIFGILTVTKAPVTEEELANLLSEQLDETELGQRLRVVQQFLDVIQNDYAENTYTLFHQSLQDYLTDKEKSGVFHCSPKDGHRRIIEYCWQYHPRDWRECDRYGLRYLATHFLDMAALEKPPIKARKYIERLHELLATEVDGRNAWFDAKDRIGETAGFLADVELAWSQADEAYDREPGKSIGLQYRYALIKTSINSLANIPSSLMGYLVKYKYWKLNKALAYIRQIPEPMKRFKVLLELTEKLSESDLLMRSQAVESTFQLLLNIQDDCLRSLALAELADKLIPKLFSQALDAALAFQDESFRARALIALADKLPLELLPRVLKAAFALEEQKVRAALFTVLADKIHEVLPNALEAALAIQNTDDRAEALTVLANKLPEALPKALEAALAIQSHYSRAEALTVLANKLPEALPKALEAALAIQSHYSRAEVLTTLADKIPEVLPNALEAALAIQNTDDRAQALTVLANKLTPELLLKTLKEELIIQNKNIGFEDLVGLPRVLVALTDKIPESLESALKIWGEFETVPGIKVLMGRLAPYLFPEILETAINIQDGYRRAEALIVLADKIPLALMSQALEAALSIGEEAYRANALRALADKLPPALVLQTLEAVIAIKNEFSRTRVLTVLADKLTPDLISQALESALAIQNQKQYLPQAITALADKLTPDLLPKALEVVQIIEDKSDCVKTLMVLANSLPSLLPHAFEAALTIQDEYARVQALMILADNLPEALPKALEAALTVRDRPWDQSGYDAHARTLTDLANKMPDAVPKALDAILTIGDEYSRLNLFVDLVGKLTVDLLPKALAAAQALQDDYCRAGALTALVDKLPEAFPKALEAIQAIQHEDYRGEEKCAEALIALAEKLPPELLPTALEVALTIRSDRDRVQALIALVNKEPHLLQQTLDDIFTIQDEDISIDALTALANKLPSNLLPKILEVSLTIQSQESRAKILTILADKLTPDLLPQTLEAALAIKDDSSRARALTALADKLTPDLLPQALEAALAIQHDYSRANVLIALAGKLPEVLPNALEATLAIKDDFSFRARALTALADKLPEVLPNAIDAILAIHDERDRADAVKVLIEKNIPEFLPQFLQVARDIDSLRSDRADVLKALADHFVIANQFYVWEDLLHHLSYRTRPDLLSDIASLTLVIDAIGGKVAIADTAQAIQDVSRWWP